MYHSRFAALCVIVCASVPACAQWKATAISPADPINRIATVGTKVVCGNIATANGKGFVYLSPDEGGTAKKDTNQFQSFLQTEGAAVYKGGGNPGSDNVFLSKSRDGGATWTDFASAIIQIPPNSQTALAAPLCLGVNGKVLLLGWENGIARSQDDGATWAASNSGLATGSPAPLGSIQKLILNGSTFYAGASAGGMFTSADDGASWKHATNGPVSGNITALGSAGAKVYAGTQGLGLFVTADQGATWTAVNLGGTTADNFIMSYASGGGNIFVGTMASLRQSSDGGVTWHAIETGLPTPGYVAALATDAKYVFAGTSKGVWIRELADFPSGISMRAMRSGLNAARVRVARGKVLVPMTGGLTTESYDLAGKNFSGPATP